MTSLLASRTFSLDDQLAFARLSSDFNPIHLDRAFARRTQAGAPVVHGIHTLAWAADGVLRACPMRVANIRARFQQPLYLDELASVRLRARGEKQIEFEVVAAGIVVAVVTLSAEPGRSAAKPELTARPETRLLTEPADVPFEQLAGQTGAVAIADSDFQRPFPALAGAIGSAGVKALLATSQVVGMACPGLHSLLTGIDINFDPAQDNANALAYAAVKVDARFRSLQIDVAGYGARGRLEAFARPAPPVQPDMKEIAGRVAGTPFAGQRSLIVGGSRGLGEVTAKIVAAGGGRPVVTYRDSKAEAEAVVADIVAAGGQCDAIPYDALQPAGGQLQNLPAIDSCYYFATPKIFQRKSALFEPDRLNLFLRFYADGFFDLCAALRRPRSGKLAVFYPSTVAIDQGLNTTTEYAMAKASGEVLASYMNRFQSDIQVVCRRLPRILTDQTAALGVARADNALDAMLPIVYEVQAMAQGRPALRG